VAFDPLSDGDVVLERRPATEEIASDEKIALYDSEGSVLIVLNPSAAAIWRLLDGTRTLTAVVEELATAFAADEAVLWADVRSTCRKLTELGLVTLRGG